MGGTILTREIILTSPLVLSQREIYLQAMEELVRPHPSIAVPGWPGFMKMTGGFRVREFSILCGGTGVGKTQFLASLSAELLKQNEKHFVMSVETGATDFMKRVISAISGQDLNTGAAINPDLLARLHTQNYKYFDQDIIEFSLYEDRTSVEQLMHDIEMAVAKGCKIVFIDNLNFFMEVTTAANQVVEMDRVIHELIIFCKKVDVHIVMVMHPKKTDHGRVESEFDVKGSSTAVQEAHNVFLLNRPKPEYIQNGESNINQREFKLAKMRRRGRFIGSTMIFENFGGRYEEKGFL
jgi:replicative DNA helicase